MPRKIKTAFSGSDEDRAITGIHDIAFLSRERDGVKGFEVRVGGGTSIMARVAPTALRLRRGRQRRLPQGRRGGAPDLRPPGLAARQPRPRPDQGPGRQDRHRRLPRAGRRGAARATGSASATSTSSACASTTTRRPDAPEAPPRARLAQRRPHRVRALPRGQRPGAAPGGLLHRRGEDHPRRPHPRAVPRPGGDHARVHRRLRPQHRAAELRPALGPRRGALRRLAAARPSSASARPAPARSPTSSAAPAPTAANSGSPARWASTGRSRSGSRRWRSATS